MTARLGPRGRAVLLLLLGWLALGLPAAAHKPSDSYLGITVADPAQVLPAGATAVSGRWDIALRDLDHAIGLDADGNGEVTWGELRARHGDIAAYALARLSITADGTACALRDAPPASSRNRPRCCGSISANRR